MCTSCTKEKLTIKQSSFLIATKSNLIRHTSWVIWFENPGIFFHFFSPLLYQVCDGNKSFLLQLILFAVHLMFNNAKFVMPHFMLTFRQLGISAYSMIYSLRACSQILLSALGRFLSSVFAVLWIMAHNTLLCHNLVLEFDPRSLAASPLPQTVYLCCLIEVIFPTLLS